LADGDFSPEFKILTSLYSKNLQFKIISTIYVVFGHNSGWSGEEGWFILAETIISLAIEAIS